jgi:hypothetical protein
MIKLKSIKAEAAKCRKAFQHSKIGDIVQHCHHEVGCETLTQAAEDRIAYILSYKPVPEQALRLRLFRPIAVKGLPAECRKARAECRKARVELQKASAELQKAGAECRKAYAEWDKADAAWRKARVELPKADAAWRKASVACRKADAEWRKARAELRKAFAELRKARVECRKADAEWLAAYNANHSVLCKEPECPWNGKTIFA